MADLNENQRNYLYGLLKSDQNSNHQLLTYYLKLVISNRPLELNIPGEKDPIVLPPEAIWKEINDWKDANSVSLPMGDSGSRKLKASRLLNYLELIQSSSREASTNLQAILKSAKEQPLQNTRPQTEDGRSLKKIIELRDLQIEIYNRQVLGQLTTKLEQTSFIKRFANDRATQIALAGLFAANAANLSSKDLSTSDMAEEITKLVQLNAGRTDFINNAAHLAYSNTAQDPILDKYGNITQVSELDELRNTIGEFLENDFPKNKNFAVETQRISSLSHILTVADIPTLIDMLAPGANAAERASLSRALQTTIIRSTSDYHTSGETLLSRAFNLAGLPESGADNLAALAPYLEEIRGTELHNTLSGGIKEIDARIQNTINLSGDIRVSAHIAWLNSDDIAFQQSEVEKLYGADFEKSLIQELTKSEGADFKKISDIRRFISNREQFILYHDSVDGNVALYWREKIGKFRGNIAASTAPVDRFYQKINKKIGKVDNFIHSPFRYLSDKLETLKEGNVWWNIFTPGEFIGIQMGKIQSRIALGVFKWSTKIARSNSFFAGAFRQVSEFSKIFYKSGGDWGTSSFHFVEKKWGNFLEWGAKKAGFEGFQGVKATIGTAAWNVFSKAAPGFAEKLASGGFGKLIASLVAGELTAGTSLLIQVGLMVVWEGLKKFKKFLTDSEYRNRFISEKLPLLLTGASIGISALPAAIVGGLIAGGSAIMGAIGAIISSLFSSVFLPALIAVGAIIGGIFLLFQVFNITIDIDSGISSLVASVICDQSKQTSSNKTANVALCIAEIANNCPGLNPVTESKLKSPSWQCLVGGLLFKNALAELEKSAHVKNSTSASEGNLQCVGLSAAAAADGDGSFSVGQINACMYATSVPQGYRYLPGCPNMQPGDHFIMGVENCTVGHIGVVITPQEGVGFTCVDANAAGPGIIQGPDKCKYAKSQISGCLRKM